jgi:hypothetical protein
MNYEKLLRRMRQRIFDYDGTGKEEKAGRALRKIKRKFLESPEHLRHVQRREHELSERMLRLWQ